MKLFTLEDDKRLVPFIEKTYGNTKREAELELLLQKNPQYFFEDSKVMIIGRQVTTNLGSVIDLLGVDKYGNLVVVELKRGQTPRGTLAQLLEYASWCETLDYQDLNRQFAQYNPDIQMELQEAHKDYFQSEYTGEVSFNKNQKLVIVAEKITDNIKQPAIYLRKSGIDIFCIEFKYFKGKNGEIYSSDFVVGKEEFRESSLRDKIISLTDRTEFFSNLDENGRKVFEAVLEIGKREDIKINWGQKGFSLNLRTKKGNIPLFMGYPSNSKYDQCLIVLFHKYENYFDDSQKQIAFYRDKLVSLNLFSKFGENNGLKWSVDRDFKTGDIDNFVSIVKTTINKYKELFKS